MAPMSSSHASPGARIFEAIRMQTNQQERFLDISSLRILPSHLAQIPTRPNATKHSQLAFWQTRTFRPPDTSAQPRPFFDSSHHACLAGSLLQRHTHHSRWYSLCSFHKANTHHLCESAAIHPIPTQHVTDSLSFRPGHTQPQHDKAFLDTLRPLPKTSTCSSFSNFIPLPIPLTLMPPSQHTEFNSYSIQNLKNNNMVNYKTMVKKKKKLEIIDPQLQDQCRNENGRHCAQMCTLAFSLQNVNIRMSTKRQVRCNLVPAVV